MNEKNFKLELLENNKKQCNKCKQFKPFSDYGKTQKRAKCKSCYSKLKKEYYKRPEVKEKERKHFLRSYFKRAYGITFEKYQQLLLQQNGKCRICKSAYSNVDKRGNNIQSLAVDHCHKTKKVRGLLCGRCNMGIGSFQDNIELLKEAINYLIDSS